MPSRTKTSKPKREAKVWIRYRAIVAGEKGPLFTGTPHTKRSDAIREGVEWAVRNDIVQIVEVPMKRKLAVAYEEVEA